jgi:hypothetical protein
MKIQIVIREKKRRDNEKNVKQHGMNTIGRLKMETNEREERK